MSTDRIVINDTVRITVKFKDIDTSGNEVDLSPVPPVTVVIKNSAGSIVESGNATASSSSVYIYDFTASSADTYSVKFTGTLSSGNSVVVEQKLYVSSTVTEYQPTITLKSDETIIFAPDVTPLYLDPEELIPYFPDASLLEIGEIVHNYSNEVKALYNLLDEEDGSGLSFTVLEYIKASAACELSRTYGFGGDDEVSVRLGDFSLTNRSVPRAKVTRDNATTWCQIAASLRKEILAGKVGPKGFQMKNLPSGGLPVTSGKIPEVETGKIVYLSDRELYGPGRSVPPQDDPMPRRCFKKYD
jgi:hypothetical protein